MGTLHRGAAARARIGTIVVSAIVAIALSAVPTGAQVTPTAGPPSTTRNVQPVVQGPNPVCPAGLNELKVNNADNLDGQSFSDATGDETPGGLVVTLNVYDNADPPPAGKLFDFEANIGVDVVISKGGDFGNVYTYDQPGAPNTEVTSDTGLHSPVNPSNNTFFGLSHLSFCYDEEAPGNVTVQKAVNGSLDHDVQFTFRLYSGDQALPANLIDEKTTNADGEGTTLGFEDLPEGTYTLCEDVPAHYSSDLGPGTTIGPATTCETFELLSEESESIAVNNIPCPDLTPSSDASADPDPGGTITINKSIPANSGPASFTYQLRGPAPATTLIDSAAINLPAAGGAGSVQLTTPGGMIGTFTVSESGPANFVPNAAQNVEITPATSCVAAVTFPGGLAPEPPAVRVVKTEKLQPGATPRAARGKWTFYLIGPDGANNGVFDPNNPGPTETKSTNTSGRRHRINWGNLDVGDYRLCEKFFGGWKSNLGGSNAILLPNGDRCIDFNLELGEFAVFRVNNRCPNARTPVPR